MLLETVENYTPFEYFAFEKMGHGRHIFDVLIVKAACELRPDPKRANRDDGIQLLAEAAPIHLGDEHHGEPERTALRTSGDLVLYKPGADLIIHGAARPPADLRSHWAAEIEVAGARTTRSQRLRLLGPRHWQWTLLKGWHLSEPTPVESLPLRYELAFGGRYPNKGEWIEHEPNPVGIGFVQPERMDRDIHYPAPQIECFDAPTKRPGAPIAVPGLGAIPRFWQARSRHAGTYDERWQRLHASGVGAGYPADFDLRFFQAAHPHWVFNEPLTGNERIALRCFDGDAHCQGRLPGLRLEALLPGAGNALTVAPLRLNTLEVDLDAARLYLGWRLAISQQLQARHVVVRMFKSD